ncbi:MAG: GyrI-like domain-containing protein [Proteobacteria bacterium]|nr:GyrI-like domain-containing protein [Pseudomonadota bacterium]
MKKEILQLQEIKLIGLSMRTSYQNEINPATAKITPCVTRFFQEQIPNKIPNLKNPHATFCAYTDYENDYKGAYTYFIGQEVTSIDAIPEDLDSLTIPPQAYVKFTTAPAPVPQVIIHAWQQIWQMPSSTLGGKRSYKVDFEIYDERAYDPQHTVIDLYVGIA